MVRRVFPKDINVRQTLSYIKSIKTRHFTLHLAAHGKSFDVKEAHSGLVTYIFPFLAHKEQASIHAVMTVRRSRREV